MMNGSGSGGTDAYVHWTREGFVGSSTRSRRPHYAPDYLSVEGSHAPRRVRLGDLAPPDRDDPAALPLAILEARSGARVSVSAREAPMPYVLANVEADEVHFVQAGALEFRTDHGTLRAEPGDFVCLPRAVQYQVVPLATPTLTFIAETPSAVQLELVDPPAGVVSRPTLGDAAPAGPTELWVRAFDGITRYRKPHQPLGNTELVTGTVPVWKAALRDLAVLGADLVGPPLLFATSRGADEVFCNLSARRGGGRPPVHFNADYDELILYVAGPGAYGSVTEPGTLTWVPKGIAHHGPTEVVPEGYLAWLLEVRSTLRFTPAALGHTEPMETGTYGPARLELAGALRG